MTGIVREETIGPCRLIQGDCLEVLPVVGRFTSAVTSPPYNNGNANVYAKNGAKKVGRYINFSDDMNPEEYSSWLRSVIESCLLFASHHVVVNIQFVSGSREAIFSLPYILKHRMKEVCVWSKLGQPAIEPGVFNSCFEFIWVFSNDKPEKRKFSDTRWHGTVPNVVVTHANAGAENKYASVHKGTMPLAVAEYLVAIGADADETILDPFMGTATTGVACIKAGRNFIGIEKEPKYFDIAARRIRQAWQDKCSEIKWDAPQPLRQLTLEPGE